MIYTNSQIESLVNEYVHSDRDRRIMKRRLVDGINYEKYAKEAILLKDERPEIANMFYKLSNEELGHVNTLHIAVTSLINEYRAEHGEPPEGMLAVYNYLHEKQIEEVAEVNAMLSQFR